MVSFETLFFSPKKFKYATFIGLDFSQILKIECLD